MIEIYSNGVITTAYTVSAVVAMVGILLFVVFAVANFSDFFIDRGREILGYVLLFGAIALAVLSLISVHILGSIYQSDVNNYYVDNIRDYYKAEVLRNSEPIHQDNEEGIKVKFDGDDSRIYEVYLITDEKNGKVSLYTKNAKGVFMPITPASAQSAYDGTSSSVDDSNLSQDMTDKPTIRENETNEDSQVSM